MSRRAGAALLVLVLSVSLLASLTLMALATQDSPYFGRLYPLLLMLNGVGLVTFIVLIAANLASLVAQLRARVPGARLTLRLATIFTALALTPALVVYAFSMVFLTRGIDSWFNLQVEQVLEDSLELSRSALDLRMRELLTQTEGLAEELVDGAGGVMPLTIEDLRGPVSTVVENAFDSTGVDLDGLRRRGGAEELTLLREDGEVLRFSTATSSPVPNLPDSTDLLQVRQGQSYIGLDPVNDAGLYVRVIVRVPPAPGVRSERFLQGIWPIPTRMNRLAEAVQAAFARYTELAYLREQLKVSFIMTLTLVLLFAIFAAIWTALHSARRLAEPIRDLADGTRAVAAGDYHRTLPVPGSDDLGFLVESFNAMTRRIAAARDEARRSRDQVDAERAWLEALLGRLSSGVISFDEAGTIRTANASAAQILGAVRTQLDGASLDGLAQALPNLGPLVGRLGPHIDSQDSDWQEQVTLFGASGRQVLMCRGTSLAGRESQGVGHVIVFDDVTALIQGQRNAAWSEVARRLAHEIKNPLTPIQLATERLRQKYLHLLEPADAETFDRLTRTIVAQVETMKGMVNTFSEYARTPRMQTASLDVGRLIDEVLDLYRAAHPEVAFETSLQPGLPAIEADVGRLRQVLNNLVKNALEAGLAAGGASVRVVARTLDDAGAPCIEMRVEDEGSGLAEEMLGQAFEPYVTSKPRGTGLGLAIVRKSVEEHGGLVWLENRAEGGAAAVVRLPVVPPAHLLPAPNGQRRDAP